MGRRHADGPAPVVAVRHRHHARGHRRRRPSRRASGSAGGVPGVAGRPMHLGLGDRGQAELRGVGLAEDDQPGAAVPGDDLVVRRGDVAGAGAGRQGVGQAGDGCAQVLDQERHPGEGALPGLSGGRLPGAVQVGVDNGIQPRVEGLDAPRGRLEQLERVHLPACGRGRPGRWRRGGRSRRTAPSHPPRGRDRETTPRPARRAAAARPLCWGTGTAPADSGPDRSPEISMTVTSPPPDRSGSPVPMPALYLGHGAPPLLDDPRWVGQLQAWAAALPRPGGDPDRERPLGAGPGDPVRRGRRHSAGVRLLGLRAALLRDDLPHPRRLRPGAAGGRRPPGGRSRAGRAPAAAWTTAPGYR